MEQNSATHKKSNWRLYLTVGTFAALLILIYTLRQEIVGVIKNLGRVNTIALLLIIPMELLNYDSYSRLYRRLFKTLGHKVRYWPMFRLTLELNFVNHVLPSGGVSGISYFSLRGRDYGISTAKSTLAQIIKTFLLFISFQPLLVLGLLLLSMRGHVNDLVMLVATSIITLLVVGTLLGLYVIESRRRINSTLTYITKFLNNLVRVVRHDKTDVFDINNAQKAFNELHDNYQVIKKDWKGLKRPFFYMLVANITEVGAVYVVYIAFGQLVNVGAVILAYAVAN